jgi:hypothetical protein
MRRFLKRNKSKKKKEAEGQGQTQDQGQTPAVSELNENDEMKEEPQEEVKEETKEEIKDDNDVPDSDSDPTKSTKEDEEVLTSSFQYTTHDNLYGQEIPNETPELLTSKFQELDQELQNIPNNDKKQWIMAEERCPQLCDDKFKLMFLRCEILNVKLAAKRIVKYWEKRVELFGDSKAFLPLVLGDDGPFKDDSEGLKIGFIRCTNTYDAAGRPILFGDPSRLPMDHSSYDPKSLVRSLWYYMHSVLEDETAQRKGTVIIMFPKSVKFAQFNRKLAQMNAESIKGCIPIRLSALHICHPPLIFDVIFPIVKVLMGAQLRKKIKVNSGSTTKVIEKLESQFGIPSENLPIEMGGSLELNHEKWLEDRLQDGF